MVHPIIVIADERGQSTESEDRCSFCGKTRSEAGALAGGRAPAVDGRVFICRACAKRSVAICDRAATRDRPEAVGQFSLRSLMFVTLAVSCWLGLLRGWPHIAVILLSGFIVALSVRLLRGLRRRESSPLQRLGAYALAVVAWVFFYVVSIGPVAALGIKVLGIDDDVFEFLYAPVVWLHDVTPLEEPLEEYVKLWGIN